MKILVVDDLIDNRAMLATVLATSGFPDVVTAASAAEAFEALDEECGDGDGVEVILMDIKMPGMDGIEACRRIKANESLRDIPVIMVTAQDETSTLEAAFDAGATDFITKPFNIVEMLARIRSAVTLKREMDCRKARERELLDVTRQLEAVNRALHRLSSLDGLTEISNRRNFDQFLATEWRRAARDGEWLSLVMLDIDFFKAFNDAYGHQAGDECLKRVAAALTKVAHRPGDLAARYGGEEFAIVLPGTDDVGGHTVAEAIRAAIERLRIPHGASETGPYVTVSLGVATLIPSPVRSASDLIAAADRALYLAKQEGRNAVRVGSFSGEG